MTGIRCRDLVNGLRPRGQLDRRTVTGAQAVSEANFHAATVWTRARRCAARS